jgi:hypothetical protein
VGDDIWLQLAFSQLPPPAKDPLIAFSMDRVLREQSPKRATSREPV